MSRAPQSGSGMWSSYTKQDPETGMFIAHCLDLHMKVSGKDAAQAWDRLKRSVKAFYEYSYQCDPEALTLTASNEEWLVYRRILEETLRHDPASVTIETIELILAPPKLPEQLTALSCQRVEFATQAASA